jgi:hypothetical protein
VTEELLFKVLESSGRQQRNKFIRQGVPLPEGRFFDTSNIHLSSDNKYLLPSSKTAIAYWPDKSIRWCIIEFVLTLNANEEKPVFLFYYDREDTNSEKMYTLMEDNSSIEVGTEEFLLHINKHTFNLFEKITHQDQLLASHGFCSLITGDGTSLTANINQTSIKIANSEEGQFYSELFFSGEFTDPSNKFSDVYYESNLKIIHPTNEILGSFTLHNPKRAIHPSGKWDLGDANSLMIKSFSLGFRLHGTPTIQWKTNAEKDWSTLKNTDINIYQESSGGENWNSPSHKNKGNTVAMTLRGYRCNTGEKELKGSRANPALKLSTSTGNIFISIEKFWQNFPKSLSISGEKVEIGLFPSQFSDMTELQPGEKKTHVFQLRLSDTDDEPALINQSISIHAMTDWARHCNLFSPKLSDFSSDPIEKIIAQGLTGDNNFFTKRELIDEYGWRNFGDIYADHEVGEYQGKEQFISHYNNQYDPLYGFIIQFFLTGDNRWYELADDLARHITDIDIYHTTRDKEEYSQGPFWHTDHYLDAATSSHRSYSKFHEYPYEGYAGGGGPGGQHCYTTGLLFHYLLTGSEASRHAVFQLCDWISCVYDGSGSILSFLMAVKHSSRSDLKNLFTGKYPLDRGTGYYINALLNKFYLTLDKELLLKVDTIIRNTVHPCDNISARSLENVELTWFYTIFFQSVYKYLSIKEELSELDDSFYYARDTLLHYADWMQEHEYPYLEKPEVLEFPNATWTAQDLRKVNVLYYAAHFSPSHSRSRLYIAKARAIYSYISDNLINDSTRTYSRILAILMQNYIPEKMIQVSSKKAKFLPVGDYLPPKNLSKLGMAKNLVAELFKVLKGFSLNKEIKWLSQRSPFFSRFFGFQR